MTLPGDSRTATARAGRDRALLHQPPPAAPPAIFGALALTHPTYALFLLVPLTAYAVLRVDEWRRSAPLVAAALVPTGLALLWLKPIVDETISHDPGPAERLRALRALRRPARRHRTTTTTGLPRRCSAGAAPSRSRRSSCCRSTGSRSAGAGRRSRSRARCSILLLTQVPWLFVHFSDAVSLSQARRVAGFAPLAVRARRRTRAARARGALVLPAALAAGIVLQRLWPGDFDYGLRHGGPALATWVALVGGLVGAGRRRRAEARPARAAWARRGGGRSASRCPSSSRRRGTGARASPATRTRSRRGSSTAAHGGAEGRRRDRAGADELPRHRRRPGVRRRAARHRTSRTRRRTTRTPASRAVHHWVLTNDQRVARRYGATWAIRSGRLYRLPR